jgi:sodium transport system permease protein
MPPKVRAVYLKELRDALRDRRTILAAIIVPLIVYPVMLLSVAEVTQLTMARLRREMHEVAVPPGMKAFFEKLHALPPDKDVEKKERPDGAHKKPPAMPGMTEEEAPTPALQFRELPHDKALAELRAGSVRAIVVAPEDIEPRIAAREPVIVEVLEDQAEQRSRDAAQRVAALFERYRRHVVQERLAAHKLDESVLRPFVASVRNVADAAKVGGSILGSMLPLLFIVMIITGAIYPAIDMTAGEKERSTLETLVSAPARPIEIISGKFLAVATLALGNAAINVASFAGTFLLLPVASTLNMRFPWAALPVSLLLLLPLALFFAALLLAVASFAANQKEAQVYCLPVYLVPVLAVAVTSMPGIELAGPLLLLPVVNTALLIKELFLYRGTVEQITFVFLSTTLYAAGAVALAARVFAREEVLFSAQGSVRLFLRRRFFTPSMLPKPGDALLVAALVFPINFYFQTWLGRILVDPTAGLESGQFALLVLLPQYLLFLGLPLAAAWYLKLDLRQTFQWRAPPLTGLLGAACLGCASWLIAQQVVAWQSHFWEYVPGEMKLVEKALEPLTESAPGIALLIFMMGVTPGLCEEHLFRGFVMQGLRRSGKWAAIITVGVIFGAYHFPIFKQPVVMLLGVALAYTAWETRSLWPAVLFHFLHNSLSVVGPGWLGLSEEPPVAGQPLPDIPVKFLLPAAALFAAGLWLVRSKRATEVERPQTGAYSA